MWQDAQKPGQKFCARKTAKMEKTHPKSSEKGETGCVLGAGEGCSRCGRVKKPGIRTKVNPKTILHMKKENRQKRSVSAGFWQGQKDLVSPAGSVGPGRSPPGCRPPRHALRRAQPCLVAESLCALTKNREVSICLPLYFWQGQKDLNPRHAVLETAALPTELYPYLFA